MSTSSSPRRRRRPLWQKPVGIAVVAASLTVVVLNDLVLLGAASPLPGGHSEGYLLAAMAAGGTGAWLTGVMDARGR